MSNHESGPAGPDQRDSHGRNRTEIAQREVVEAAEQLVRKRLEAHQLAKQERAESPRGTRTERARQAIKRAWTERGDRRLERQAERAGMLVKEVDVAGPEEAAIRRAHAVLDQPQDVEATNSDVEEAREAVQTAAGTVPPSREVQMEGLKRLGPDDEPTLAETAEWSVDDPSAELGLAQEIDSIPEPSRFKQAWLRATGRLRSKRSNNDE